MRTKVLALAFGLLAPLAAAPVADAAITLTYSGTDPNRVYTLTGTAANETVTADAVNGAGGRTYTFTSPQTITGTPTGCGLSADGQTATCTTVADRVVLNGGDGDDTLSFTNSALPFLDPIPAAALNGGDGEDALTADEGIQTLSGGDDDDTIEGGTGTDTISCGVDAAEDDVVSYDDARTSGVQVDLSVDDAPEPDADGENLSPFCDGVIGSGFADVLTGDEGANFLSGGDGGDVINGRNGDDVITPGAGADSANGEGAVDTLGFDDGRATGVTVNLASTSATQFEGDAGEQDRNFESVLGSRQDDVLIGTSGVNAIAGNSGDDTLRGAGGADAISGGAVGITTTPGNDTLDCSDRTAVTVVLNSTAVFNPGAVGCDAGEILVDTDNVIGTPGVDNLSGDGGANVLDGLAGNDTLDGRNGSDVAVGGMGFDTLQDSGTGVGDRDAVSYDDGRWTGVTVDLANAPAIGGDTGAGNDTASSGAFENVIGSQQDDTLRGNAGPNAISGGGGADTIDPGGAADSVDAGADNDNIRTLDGVADSVVCGPGTDTLMADDADTRDGCETPSLPQPQPQPGNGPGAAAPDRVKPTLSRLSLSPTAFQAAKSGPSQVAAVGTRASYRLSEAATTTFTVESGSTGRKSGKSCVKRTRKNAKRKACTRYTKVRGSFARRGAAGVNRFTFRGRIGNKRLRAGRYRLVGVARDGAGNKSTAVKAGFRITK